MKIASFATVAAASVLPFRYSTTASDFANACVRFPNLNPVSLERERCCDPVS